MSERREPRLTSAGVTVLVLIGVLLIVGPIALFVLPRMVSPLIGPPIAVPGSPLVNPNVSDTLVRSGKDVIVTLSFDNTSATPITSMTYTDLKLNGKKPVSMPSSVGVAEHSKHTTKVRFRNIKSGECMIEVSYEYTFADGSGSSSSSRPVIIP